MRPQMRRTLRIAVGKHFLTRKKMKEQGQITRVMMKA